MLMHCQRCMEHSRLPRGLTFIHSFQIRSFVLFMDECTTQSTRPILVWFFFSPPILNGSSFSSVFTEIIRTLESFSILYLINFHPSYLLKATKKNKTSVLS